MKSGAIILPGFSEGSNLIHGESLSADREDVPAQEEELGVKASAATS